MYRILIADSLGGAGIELLRDAGVEVDLLASEDRDRLADKIGNYEALIVRSATQVTAELLAAAKKLRVVGRAGIGVDNIDVRAATERGVLVVNAPTANLLSATEHTFALLLSLARKVPAADGSLKSGVWDRKSFVGTELFGKTLGIIGFGQIGQRVAARARAFEMEVVAHDPFLSTEVAERLGVEVLELDDLLARADCLTFHTPLTDQTRGMLDAERLKRLKKGALIVNCGRGGVIDEEALLAALESGHIAGAGLDVFASEPPADFKLAQHPRVVATPHIGAQTQEAQERISTEAAKMVLAALEGSLTVSAVNLPFRAAGPRSEPYLRLGEQLGRFASTMLDDEVRGLRIDLWGLDEDLRQPVAVAALKGALTPFLGEGVNYVNAEQIGKERGIEVVRSTHSQPAEYSQLVNIRVGSDDREVDVAGTLSGADELRVVRFLGFHLEFRPEGKLLVVRNADVPGVVGKLGTLLGDAGVNIADIHLARREGASDALAVLRLDVAPGDEVLESLRSLAEVNEVSAFEIV